MIRLMLKYLRSGCTSFALLLLFSFLFESKVLGQETLVVGQVINSSDKSPLENIHVFFKNSKKATLTNAEGFFMVRSTVPETRLVFSGVGFKTKEVKVVSGMPSGLTVELEEQNNELMEVMVVPGANPALDLLRGMQKRKTINDATKNKHLVALYKEQNLILLNKVNRRTVSKQLFEQLSKGSIYQSDSVLTLPLFMQEQDYRLQEKKKEYVTSKLYASDQKTEQLLHPLNESISNGLNFYENTVTIFGKSFVSPLAVFGTAYYKFYLVDSLKQDGRKTYRINFRSVNPKNLAFQGSFYVDSADYALQSIEVHLPGQVNLNFVDKLHLSQQFTRNKSGLWVLSSEQIATGMTYALLSDSLVSRPELLIQKHLALQDIQDIEEQKEDSFAQSELSTETLEQKMSSLNETPFLRFVKWAADAGITGYMEAGKMDIGKLSNLARLTHVEGLRLNVPLRTNEHLWENLCLGGYVGIGSKNQKMNYAATGQWRLLPAKNLVLELMYMDDYRRIDYDYSDFFFRENPHMSGDEDLFTTVLAMRSGQRMSERKEFSSTVSIDWSSDIESSISFNRRWLFNGTELPLMQDGSNIGALLQQNLCLVNRISVGEKVYLDHFQKIYIPNYQPVIYTLLEGAQYAVGAKTGTYLKVSASMRQILLFDFGQLNYELEGGWMSKQVPYPFLKMPAGSQTQSFYRYRFNLLDYMEVAADQYFAMHHELMFNGLLFNQIPVVNKLNLRELVSFKMFYGTLSGDHNQLLQLPQQFNSMEQPHMELGVGCRNLFRLFTLQSVWRLGGAQCSVGRKWGLFATMRISF